MKQRKSCLLVAERTCSFPCVWRGRGGGEKRKKTPAVNEEVRMEGFGEDEPEPWGGGGDVRTAAKAPSVGWHEGAVYLRLRSEIKVEKHSKL